MGHVVGVDIGGTFTDCIIVGDGGQLTIGKAPSTPPDFETGFIDAIAAAGHHVGIPLEQLVAEADGIFHGCTVGTNALVENRTAKVGLLTTRGHRDAIAIMRGGQRLWSAPPDYIAHLAAHTKDAPLLPKDMIEEVDERIAFDGAVVVELDEAGAVAAIRRLVDTGAEAIAISCIWSVANPVHEERLVELVAEHAPGTFISVASEVVNRTGEYERTTAAVINALVGSVVQDYLERVEGRLKELGFGRPLQVMTCAGGVVAASEARRRPILTMHSGPVGGLIGAGALAAAAGGDGGAGDVITADMGGTTLDVGVLRGGVPIQRPTTWHGQYEYFIPTLDVQSIGAGGGSIVRYDEQLSTLRVGPQSAGARPGPACYGRGGELATVTDADLVVGYIDPQKFLSGEMVLQEDAARRALAAAGAAVGFDDEQTATAALRIVESQMADAIRVASVQQGYDPRGFSLFAFGGAGPLHGAALARQLGIRRVVIPLSDLASGWSAFGVASADVLVVEDFAVSLTSPFSADELKSLWPQIEEHAMARMTAQGVPADAVVIERATEMRYRGQVNEVEVPAPGGDYDDAKVQELIGAFEVEYSRLFGEGTGYAAAGMAITRLMVRARASAGDFTIQTMSDGADAPLEPIGERGVVGPRGRAPVAVYDGALMRPGHQVTGPAIVEFPDTSVVVPDAATVGMDPFGSVVVDLHQEGEGR
ncbi:hydantoinase/oxoprolinase family protein [Baekduia soli]|uniref:Hydantoinase/oxoprolinase family protein n=1 Tax=Baekduia soli TaxID=496014 RepID=A0A5B8UCM9_9ACTN|nr:hydantoinase/oxoprolinase family protein [Baekduia soli]QEC50412.1 hydantoinase/oxoprolinase family protein [Baekduia soli]